MGALAWTILATLFVSLLAWVGVLTFFMKRALLDRLLLRLVALAAGSMIGGAFFHLLPNAIAAGGTTRTLPLFLFVVLGFTLFYVLEQFAHWHHHHVGSHEHEPVTHLVLLSDAVHNLSDGLVIAGAFLTATPVGLVTVAVIALHEIPQEIGDFGVLIHGGMTRKRALVLNYLTQATVIPGGIAGWYLGEMIGAVPVYLLAFAAGHFIYIASSDLIPAIKNREEVGESWRNFAMFAAGVGAMLGIRLLRTVVG